MVEGEGLRAERARKRQFRLVSGLSVLGAVAIGAMITAARIATGTPLGHLPPAAAIAAALLLPILFLVTKRWTWRQADELDRLDNLKASQASLSFYFLATWAWLVLGMGDIVPRPTTGSVTSMFVAICLFNLAALGWIKHRR